MPRSAEPITCGGGPPAPSRNNGKNKISPTAWAARADGSTAPSRTPMPTKATAPSAKAATTRPIWCIGGRPYTGAATTSRIADPAATATSPVTSWASANDHRGNPAAANRRSTPRSR